MLIYLHFIILIIYQENDYRNFDIQAPFNSGSIYYNYKSQHSLNLFALCDAQYRFIAVDIRAEGRQNDGGDSETAG